MRDSGSLLGYTSVPLLLTLLLAVPAARLGRPASGPAPFGADAPPAGFRTDTSIDADRHAFGIGGVLIRRHAGAEGARPGGLRILVATVPDPRASSLDWMYDSYLAAIRRAFEAAGSVLDRSWFPAAGDSVALSVGETVIRVPASDTQPGVMLFKDVATGALSLVYLVGEVPTAGVHTPALEAALAERWTLLVRQHGRPPLEPDGLHAVQVLGPSFSGSATSLRAGLDAWAASARAGDASLRIRFDVTTGAATAAVNAEILGGDGSDPSRSVRHTFRSTVHSDDAYEAALHAAVLGPLGVDPRDVAYLVEGNTAYGSGLVEGGTAATYITFPTNIGSLREEYARNPETEPEGVGGAPLGSPTARLPISLSTRPRPRENPPPRSPLTPAALDLLMDQIGATLEARHVRAVGILATDVRDKLFLARVVKDHLRDAQLFTFESNVLFLRPDFGRSLRGMLVLSTYPLVMETQSLTGAAGGFLPFSHDGAQGVYNAVLLLLGEEDRLIGYRSPDPTFRAAAETVPPVWVSTVGSGHLVPVTIAEADDPYVTSVETSPRAPDHVHALLSLLGTSALLALLVLVLPRLVAPDPEGGTSEDLVVPLVAALSVVTPFTALAVNPERARPGDWQALPDLATGVALAALLGVMGLHAFRMLRGWRHPRAWEKDARNEEYSATVRVGNRIVPLLAIALGALASVFTVRIWSVSLSDPMRYAVFRLRVLRLDGGVSPLLPLLLAAVTLGFGHMWHLSRSRLLATRHPLEAIPEPHPDRAAAWSGTILTAAAAIGKVRRTFVEIVPGGWLGGVLLLVVPAFALLLPLALDFRTVENVALPGLGPYTSSNLILAWTLLTGLSVVLGATLHLLRGWSALSEGLSALAETPLLPAFARVPQRIRALGRLHLFDPPSIDRGESVARLSMERAKPWLEARGVDVGELEAAAQREGPDGEGAGRADALRREEAIRNETVRRLFSELQKEWQAHPDRIRTGLGEKKEEPAELAPLREAETAAAVEVVRFLDWSLRNLRRLALLLMFAVLITTALLVSYPNPRRGLTTALFIVLMMFSLGSVLMMMAQLSQDEVLSAVNATTPGRIDWNRSSMLSVIVFVSLPILGLLGAEIPAIGRVLFAWIDPLLRVLTFF